MTDSEARFGRITPIVPTRNVEGAIAFYRDKLGFKELYRRGGELAGMNRDDAEILLVRCREAAAFAWAGFRIQVTGIEALYEACIAHGIVHPDGLLAETAWHTAEFKIQDRDGVLITVWERRRPPPQPR